MNQRIFMAGIAIVIVAWAVVLAAVALSGEGYDGILRRNMLEAGLTPQEASEALLLPQDITDIMVADMENPLIPPVEFIYFSYDGKSAIVFEITDTIRGRVVYNLDRNAKK